jgi:hypothetical protein
MIKSSQGGHLDMIKSSQGICIDIIKSSQGGHIDIIISSEGSCSVRNSCPSVGPETDNFSVGQATLKSSLSW